LIAIKPGVLGKGGKGLGIGKGQKNDLEVIKVADCLT